MIVPEIGDWVFCSESSVPLKVLAVNMERCEFNFMAMSDFGIEFDGGKESICSLTKIEVLIIDKNEIFKLDLKADVFINSVRRGL